MRTYTIKRFKQLPKNCRVWLMPTTGKLKDQFCLCAVTNGGKARIIETNQIFFPRMNALSLVENQVDTSKFNYSIIIKTSPEKANTMTTKTAKKAVKKSTKKTAKKSTGRKANAESMASKIGALHAKGKSNAEIAEALGCTNKYVCDVTWRIANPGGKKKGK